VPALLEQVSTAARRAGLDIASVQPLPMIVGEEFDTYRYKISVAGSYHPLAEFLTNVGSLTRIIAPANLQLELAPDAAATGRRAAADALLKATFEIQTTSRRGARRPRSRARASPPPTPLREPLMSFLDGIRATTHGQSRRIAIGIAMGGVRRRRRGLPRPWRDRRGRARAPCGGGRRHSQRRRLRRGPYGRVDDARRRHRLGSGSRSGTGRRRSGEPGRRRQRVASDSAGVPAALLGREAFAYRGQGRRDPFASLLKAGGDLRPLITDLRLVGVLVGTEAATRWRSCATSRRRSSTAAVPARRSADAHRAHRVRQVVFTIEEFGYSRQEVLTYGDSTTMRTK
jgi:hypothetical protein